MEIERKEVFVARGEILAVSVFLVYSSLIAPTSSGGEIGYSEFLSPKSVTRLASRLNS